MRLAEAGVRSGERGHSLAPFSSSFLFHIATEVAESASVGSGAVVPPERRSRAGVVGA